MVTEWNASGESAVGFADRIGVASQTLYRWRTALGGVPQPARDAALAKIVEVRATRPAADDRFELRLVSGRSVAVPASFDETALARLLRVVEAAS